MAFTALSNVQWVNVIAAGLAVALLLISIAIHVPRSAPGPLLPNELAIRHRGSSRRVALGLLPSLLSVAAVVMLVHSMFPVKPSIELVLWSRGRAGAISSQDYQKAAASANARDLGPVVDAVVSDIRTANNHSRGATRLPLYPTVQGEVQLRDLLLQTIERQTWNLPQPQHPVAADAHEAAEWWIEPVEISLVQLALQRFNVEKVTVAPAPTSELVSGWSLAKAFIKVPVFLTDAHVIRRDRATVRLLARAELTPAGELSAWAVIDGPIKSSVKVPLRLTGLDSDLFLSIPSDEQMGRVVRYVGNVKPSVRQQLVLSAEGGRVTTRVTLVGQEPAPTISIVGDEGATPKGHAASPWASAIQDLSSAEDATSTALREELSQMGVRMPTVGTGPTDAVLYDDGEVVVVAKEAAIAREVAASLDQIEPLGATVHTPGRFTNSGVGPTTVFSLSGLPWSGSGRVVAERFAPTTYADHAAKPLGSGFERGSQHEVLFSLWHGAHPVVALHLQQAAAQLQPGSPSYTREGRLALVRFAAWALGEVHHPEQRTLRALASLPPSRVTRPVLTAHDLEQARAKANRSRDGVAFFMIGLALTVAFSSPALRLLNRRRRVQQ